MSGEPHRRFQFPTLAFALPIVVPVSDEIGNALELQPRSSVLQEPIPRFEPVGSHTASTKSTFVVAPPIETAADGPGR